MNKKLIIALVVIVVLGGGVWAYFATRPNASAPQATEPSSETENQPSDTESETAAEIVYTDDGFSPKTLTVKAETNVRVVNQSSGPLQLSSDDHPTHTKHPELNMSTIAAGSEGALEVKTVGTWGYHNHQKSSDKGTIVVTE